VHCWSTVGGVGKGGVECAAALGEENCLVGNIKPILNTQALNAKQAQNLDTKPSSFGILL
jgi:hypothetical protein